MKINPVHIKKESYNKANAMIQAARTDRTADSTGNEKTHRIRQTYLSEAEELARKGEILDYEASDFPVTQLLARMLLAYDLEARAEGYPKPLQRKNIAIGRSDDARWKDRTREIESSIALDMRNRASMFLDTGDQTVKRFGITAFIRDLNNSYQSGIWLNPFRKEIDMGPFCGELSKLDKAMRSDECVWDLVVVIHRYFKTIQYATQRLAKEMK